MEFPVFFQVTFFILVAQVRNSSSLRNSMTEIPKKNAEIQLLNRNNQGLEDKIKDLEQKLQKCKNDLEAKDHAISKLVVDTKSQDRLLNECLNNLVIEQNETQKCEEEKRENDLAISDLRAKLTGKERDYEDCQNESNSLDQSITIFSNSTIEKDMELQKCRKALQEEPNKTKICEDEKKEKDPNISALRANLTVKERDFEICERERMPLRTENEQLLNQLNQEREKGIIYEKTIIIIQEEIEQLKKGSQVVKKVDQVTPINPSQVETKQGCPIIPNLLDVLNVAQTVKKGFSRLLRSVIRKFKINE